MLEGMLIKAIWIVAICSGLPLFASTIASILVAILQAMFSIQEQSTVYLIKILSISGVLYLITGQVVELVLRMTEENLLFLFK